MPAALNRWWMGLNYRHCKVEAYLAYMRGENAVAADWESRAADWDRRIFRDYINRRFAA